MEQKTSKSVYSGGAYISVKGSKVNKFNKIVTHCNKYHKEINRMKQGEGRETKKSSHGFQVRPLKEVTSELRMFSYCRAERRMF